MTTFITTSGNIAIHILHSHMRLHPLPTCLVVQSNLAYVSDKLINLGILD
jgi:hypothetical protein